MSILDLIKRTIKHSPGGQVQDIYLKAALWDKLLDEIGDLQLKPMTKDEKKRYKLESGGRLSVFGAAVINISDKEVEKENEGGEVREVHQDDETDDQRPGW